MGSKRGRLLIRQNRVKKECDGEDMGVTIPRVVERQCSEPGPSQSPTQPSPNLLTVPQATYLVKQHSSPLLPSPATVQVHLVTPPSETMPSIRVRTEELRRASSTPLVISCLNITFHSSPNIGFNFFTVYFEPLHVWQNTLKLQLYSDLVLSDFKLVVK